MTSQHNLKCLFQFLIYVRAMEISCQMKKQKETESIFKDQIAKPWAITLISWALAQIKLWLGGRPAINLPIPCIHTDYT